MRRLKGVLHRIATYTRAREEKAGTHTHNAVPRAGAVPVCAARGGVVGEAKAFDPTKARLIPQGARQIRVSWPPHPDVCCYLPRPRKPHKGVGWGEQRLVKWL